MTQAEIKKALEASARESYTPKTDEEIRSQAEGMYKQQFENDLKALRRQTEQNILAARRDSLSTGMQRSSYVAAQQGLARSAGLEGQQQLQSNYESNIANAIADLRDKDRDRKLADDQYRNQLLLQLYNMGKSGGGGKPKTPDKTPQIASDPVPYDKRLLLSQSEKDVPRHIATEYPNLFKDKNNQTAVEYKSGLNSLKNRYGHTYNSRSYIKKNGVIYDNGKISQKY